MEDINSTPASEAKIIISISDIKKYLKNGVTRKVGDVNYNPEIGSIEQIYNLNKGEVTALFQDSRLKGLKVLTPKPSRIIIAEDMETLDQGTSELDELDETPSGDNSEHRNMGSNNEELTHDIQSEASPQHDDVRPF